MVALDPQAKALLDRMAQASAGKPAPPLMDDATWAAAGRAMHRGIVALSGVPEAVAHVEDREIPGPGGALRLRLYRPADAAGQGALLYFHGGGFVSGDLDTHDTPLRAVANRARQTVVAVDYRLAPEHRYPAAHVDGLAALTWLNDSAVTLNINPTAIAVGGDSAGGTLAIAVAMMARDRGGPTVAKQVLIYPNTDLTEDRDYPSIRDHAPRPTWRADMDRYFRVFVPVGMDRRQAYISPIHATDVTRLPETLMVTAEADPLRDEAVLLAQRLKAAGVTTIHTEYAGMIHGFFQMAGVLDAGKTLLDDVAAFLAGRA